MKFATWVLTAISLFPLLAAQSAWADPSDIICTVLNSGGITLDFSVDPVSGSLVGLAVYTVPPPVASGVSPAIAQGASTTTNFPITQIANFWLDLDTMDVHGVDPNTHQQSIFVSYNRGLALGRITMALSGYPLNDQVMTCSFD